jgi:hypothetical protein
MRQAQVVLQIKNNVVDALQCSFEGIINLMALVNIYVL